MLKAALYDCRRRGPWRLVLNTGIVVSMGKSPRVTFKYNRVSPSDWQIEAHYPGAEIRYIKNFKSKAEIDEWLQGSLCIDWLRSQGYAK